MNAPRRYLAECVGTFILVAIGPGAAMVSAATHAFGPQGVSLAFGLAVALIVAALGHVSGAHINPAVTVGLWSVRRFPARDVVPYVVAQCVGAIAASWMLVWLVGPVGNFGATIPSVGIGRAFAIEAGFTAILGLVIMAVATDARASVGAAPFAIGATVFAGALVTGPLTGGSFNPARSLARRSSVVFGMRIGSTGQHRSLEWSSGCTCTTRCAVRRRQRFRRAFQ